MRKSIKISKNNYLDYIKFAQNRLSKKSTNGNFTKGVVASLFTTVALMSAFQTIGRTGFSDFHWQTSLATAIPFIIFSGLLVLNSIRIKKSFVPNENGIIIGEKSIEFTEKGIHEVNAFGSCFIKWEAVEAIEENKGDIYIFVDKNAAIIIPSDTFDSLSEKEEFKMLIGKYA
ncbi:hypothetical protein AND4_07744 [Vibrio sp. AND4]|nr:hypothetical protein AND4_07744 [Vibrio sp. AND4]